MRKDADAQSDTEVTSETNRLLSELDEVIDQNSFKNNPMVINTNVLNKKNGVLKIC